jgi:putative flippase GtrA
VRPVAISPRLRRFIRFALGSALATLVSAVAFWVMFHTLHSPPELASVTAFASGAVVNFVSNRYWAWDRRTRTGLSRDLGSYAVLAIATALAAAGVTRATKSYAPHVNAFAAHLAVVVEASYFATYAAMFLVKFALLDKVIFRSGSERDKTAVSPSTPATGSSTNPGSW